MSDADGQKTWVQQLIEGEPELKQLWIGSGAWLKGVCRLASRALPAAGVGVTVMSGSGQPSLSIVSDAVSRRVEELQFLLGEGPCLDAYRTGRPVIAADLLGDPSGWWPAYAPAARDLGVEAVFAFPMQLGTTRLGVLDVYRDRPGRPSASTIAMAQAFADQTLTSLLLGQSTADDGRGAEAVEEAANHRMEVYQAQGMVAAQLRVGVDDALLRMRAHAFAHDRHLGDVAADIITRRLALARDDGPLPGPRGPH